MILDDQVIIIAMPLEDMILYTILLIIGLIIWRRLKRRFGWKV